MQAYLKQDMLFLLQMPTLIEFQIFGPWYIMFLFIKFLDAGIFETVYAFLAANANAYWVPNFWTLVYNVSFHQVWLYSGNVKLIVFIAITSFFTENCSAVIPCVPKMWPKIICLNFVPFSKICGGNFFGSSLRRMQRRCRLHSSKKENWWNITYGGENFQAGRQYVAL